MYYLLGPHWLSVLSCPGGYTSTVSQRQKWKPLHRMYTNVQAPVTTQPHPPSGKKSPKSIRVVTLGSFSSATSFFRWGFIPISRRRPPQPLFVSLELLPLSLLLLWKTELRSEHRFISFDRSRCVQLFIIDRKRQMTSSHFLHRRSWSC